jgi:hypothetical protein
MRIIALMNQKSQTGIYFQDTWKVTRKLTLDLGLRWDYGTYAHEQYVRNGSIGLAIPNPNASGRLGATQFEAVCKCNFAKNYPYAYGPRIGVAYQIDRKTVLRAGIGVVYNSTSTSSGASTASAASGTFPTNSGQITGFFKDGMPSSVRAVWPSFDPGVGQGVGQVVGMPSLLDPNAGRPARLLQWNIGLQRELNRNLVVEASYVGNRGAWWTASGLATLNALSQDTLKAYGFTDFHQCDRCCLGEWGYREPDRRKGQSGRPRHHRFPIRTSPSTQTVRQSPLGAYPQYSAPLELSPGASLGTPVHDSFQLECVTPALQPRAELQLNYNYPRT